MPYARTIIEYGMTMERISSYDDDEDLWHPTGWSPVFDGTSIPSRLVGFTTLKSPVPRFMMSRPGSRGDGAFHLTGEARRVLRGEFYGWVVESGDWRDMPDFWLL